MRLTFYSDYSLRLLMYAALKPDALITIQEVADAYGISKNHLTKVAFDLGRAGFLETVRGRGGGLKLARKPEEIGLGDVLRVTEAHSVLVECFNPMTNSCAISGPCRLKGVLGRALKAYFTVLDEYTIADLTGKNPALSRLLLPAA
ncbi:MAG TPA: Rrf2 family transcriptional regulator [Rhizomicrobium sp.]|jgi:Rrf2 family nitric oxide-sensitive transcriptional repressor|nr:Rrf2 family transcriptional regulator [Rhizomicrobium sp.]